MLWGGGEEHQSFPQGKHPRAIDGILTLITNKESFMEDFISRLEAVVTDMKASIAPEGVPEVAPAPVDAEPVEPEQA